MAEVFGLDVAAWERWIRYRKEIRKSLKPVSYEAAQKRLASFGEQQSEVVEQSIANGWQGLFPLRDVSRGANRYNGEPRLSAFERSEQKLHQWCTDHGIDPAEI